MRILDESAITATIGFPVKSGTLQHIQNAYTEVISELAKCIIGSAYSPSTVYILEGCVNTGSGLNYVISAGSVFYNGQVYLVAATSFTATEPDVAVGIITLSYFSAANADSVQFTDGILRNVHQIFTVVPQAGLSGSGAGGSDGDFTNWVKISTNIKQVNITGTGLADVTGSYPNINVDVTLPATGILTTGSVNLGDIPGGGTEVSIEFTSSVATSSYMVVGSFFSNGTHLTDSACEWAWWAPTTDGFQAEFSETASGVENVVFYYAIIAL